MYGNRYLIATDSYYFCNNLTNDRDKNMEDNNAFRKNLIHYFAIFKADFEDIHR